MYFNLKKFENEIWSLANSIGRLAAKAIFLITILSLFPHDILSIWYIFLAILGIVSIFEAAYKPLLLQKLSKLREIKEDWYNLLIVSLRNYSKIFILFIVVLELSGIIYFKIFKNINIIFLWSIFVVYISILSYASLFGSIISSFKSVKYSQVAEFSGNVLSLIILLFLFSIKKLDGMAQCIFALLIGSILTLIINYKILSSEINVYKKNNLVIKRKKFELKNGEYIWMILSVSSYAIATNLNYLIIVNNTTSKISAEVGFISQILGMSSLMCGAWVTAAFPRLAAMNLNKQDLLKDVILLAKNTLYSLLIFNSLATIFGYVFYLYVRDEQIFSVNYMIIIGISSILESFFSTLGLVLIAFGRVRYVSIVSFAVSIFILISTVVGFWYFGEEALIPSVILRIFIYIIYGTLIIIELDKFLRDGKITNKYFIKI